MQGRKILYSVHHSGDFSGTSCIAFLACSTKSLDTDLQQKIQAIFKAPDGEHRVMLLMDVLSKRKR